MPSLTEVPYQPDSSALFRHIAERPWAVYLDSGQPAASAGRFDILTSDPYLTLSTWGGRTQLRTADGVRWSEEDPFELLRQSLGPWAAPVADLPFSGGAIGWFGYDLGRRIERMPVSARDAEQIPDMAVGLYDWALVVDHQQGRAVLVSQGRDPATRGRWRSLVEQFRSPGRPAPLEPFRVTGPLECNLDRDLYGRAFDRIKAYIREGDCYQVNFARRFAASATGDGWPAYRELRRRNPAPFGAFISTPHGQVLSSSPERFLQVSEGRVQTRPIKGTRPRHADPAQDRALAEQLAASPKDRAENLMIVDLLRNDLGRVCRPGSVRVPELFRVESFASVHHLVSTVTGELAPGQDAAGLLRACFPGGSITGAPKVRAMQIIEELEPHRRGVYCGSLAYLGFDGSMDSNIAIRTLVYNRGLIRCWAGGGIVQDSEVQSEYEETLHKAAPMLMLMRENGTLEP
jgi:para-aminobenzoate synthetase component 1